MYKNWKVELTRLVLLSKLIQGKNKHMETKQNKKGKNFSCCFELVEKFVMC